MKAGLICASLFQDQMHTLAWHVSLAIKRGSLVLYLGSLVLRLFGQKCAQASAVLCSPAAQLQRTIKGNLVPCRLLGRQKLKYGRGTHSCTADQVHPLTARPQ